MSISVTKVKMSVADLSDDVVADLLADAEAGFDTEDHKVVALCSALSAQRRGMRNIIELYGRTSRENITLKREIAANFTIHAAEVGRLQIKAEVARRHALKMRADALIELAAAEEFCLSLGAVVSLALDAGVTEQEIDAAIIKANDV